jgi:hypothetical protein
MFAAPLGMAAVSLQDQMHPLVLLRAQLMADKICNRLIQYMFDRNGAFDEGVFYELWTMKQLVYYFHARKRFDGYAYDEVPEIRAVERALAYELLPQSGGYTNNLADANYATLPFSLNTAYFDWAVGTWSSGLSAWMWDRVAGTYGSDRGVSTDKVATALWNGPVAMTHPDSVLPNHYLWDNRGLYYFRTGWPSGPSSDDVVFSFYSGKFQGGHAQEDQNQFTLYAYGEKFAVDHGAGSVARQSEAHNMVFIDGEGQHHAGGLIGTDGLVAEYLLSEFADYLVGDATAAYSTYSEFNTNGWPYPGTDWSWGHTGANPVEHALRRVLVVHGPQSPYFILMDDIDKDGQTHEYEWRLHTSSANTIDTSTDPIVIERNGSALDLHVLNPTPDTLTTAVEFFNNLTTEPDAWLIRLSTIAVNPRFEFLMFPRGPSTPVPSVAQQSYSWGYAVTLDWGGGTKDHFVRNDAGESASHAGVKTDARLAVVRVAGGAVAGYIVVDATTLERGGDVYVSCSDGRMGCGLWDGVVDIDRYDADYRLLDLGVERVRYRSQELGFVVDAGYVTSDGVTGAPTRGPSPSRIDVRVHPNPFNPRTTIRIGGAQGLVEVVVFDVAGRRVRELWRGAIEGGRDVYWNGRNDLGERVASGTYFVRVRSAHHTRVVKAVVVK